MRARIAPKSGQEIFLCKLWFKFLELDGEEGVDMAKLLILKVVGGSCVILFFCWILNFKTLVYFKYIKWLLFFSIRKYLFGGLWWMAENCPWKH